MRIINLFSKLFLYTLLLFSFLIVISCSDDFLEEEPKGILTPENVFSDKEGFESAMYNLYRLGRGLRTSELLSDVESDKAITAMYGSGTDLGWYWDKKSFFGDYNLINSENPLAREYWKLLFSIIKDSNVIISRLNDSPLLDDDKEIIEAEARFFRAYAYRYLVHLYGAVPKITEEFMAPKLDFERVPISEIYSFIIDDLQFSTQNLPVINPGNGRLSKAAADHILAETYIAIGDFDEAIASASRVINDGQYQLMTERFGNYSDRPGDVFWDLFRLGNQNGSSGNRESILVWQMEFNTAGGEAEYRFERAWGPRLEGLRDSQGNKAIIPADTIGRPIAFFIPSPYLETEIWMSDFDNDIRNSKYNMQREFYINNPDSPEFGEVVKPKESDLYRHHFVWIKKASHPEGHPQGYDPNGRLYTDIYAIRLAETYLLRAEAYLKKEDVVSAAADINVVRKRAQATPVAPGDINIEYILDERARELVGEEPRRLTLSRMGLLDERVIRHNPISGPTIQPFHNLLPIPQSEIDRIEGGEDRFPQNPGY